RGPRYRNVRRRDAARGVALLEQAEHALLNFRLRAQHGRAPRSDRRLGERPAQIASHLPRRRENREPRRFGVVLRDRLLMRALGATEMSAGGACAPPRHPESARRTSADDAAAFMGTRALTSRPPQSPRTCRGEPAREDAIRLSPAPGAARISARTRSRGRFFR